MDKTAPPLKINSAEAWQRALMPTPDVPAPPVITTSNAAEQWHAAINGRAAPNAAAIEQQGRWMDQFGPGSAKNGK